MVNNVLADIPVNLEKEVVESIVNSQGVRIERIVSYGHTSPETGWYDQEESEWVVVLQGSGTLVFEGSTHQTLKEGDCVNIPAHKKHKVAWTDPLQPTVWLAVFYK